MYTDDTTIYCMGSTIDHVTTLLNDALNELLLWMYGELSFSTLRSARPWFYLEEASLVY